MSEQVSAEERDPWLTRFAALQLRNESTQGIPTLRLVCEMAARIAQLERELEQTDGQARINAQTVVRQANEIRKLERLLDVEKRALAAEHETQERFR